LPESIDAAKGPIKSLYELGSLLGRSALLAALSFVAYLLGSIELYEPNMIDELALRLVHGELPVGS
jgi:hypothetical protein